MLPSFLARSIIAVIATVNILPGAAAPMGQSEGPSSTPATNMAKIASWVNQPVSLFEFREQFRVWTNAPILCRLTAPLIFFPNYPPLTKMKPGRKKKENPSKETLRVRKLLSKRQILGLKDQSDKLPLFAWRKDPEELKDDPIVNTWLDYLKNGVQTASNSQVLLWFQPRRDNVPIVDQLLQAENQMKLRDLRELKFPDSSALNRGEHNGTSQASLFLLHIADLILI